MRKKDPKSVMCHAVCKMSALINKYGFEPNAFLKCYVK